MKESEYMPLRPSESGQLQLLFGAKLVLEDAAKTLEKRLKACGRHGQYGATAKWVSNTFEAMLTTIEPRKRKLFEANLNTMEMRVVNRHHIDTRPDMSLVYTDDYRALLVDCVRHNCAICFGYGEDMRRCKFRKLMKNCTLFELDEANGICAGRQLCEAISGEGC